MKRAQILAHRGWWCDQSGKNSVAALQRALEAGFGIETDFRDLDGRIMISHDPPTTTEPLREAAWLFNLVCETQSKGRLALNIKSDGLQSELIAAIREAGTSLDQLYAFDMAVPDAIGYLNVDFPVYTRMSEYEEHPSFLSQASGVWIDNFTGAFPQIDKAQTLLDSGFRATIVSSELHNRDHKKLWDEVAKAGLHSYSNFELCTDYPQDAADFFGASST